LSLKWPVMCRVGR